MALLGKMPDSSSREEENLISPSHSSYENLSRNLTTSTLQCAEHRMMIKFEGDISQWNVAISLYRDISILSGRAAAASLSSDAVWHKNLSSLHESEICFVHEGHTLSVSSCYGSVLYAQKTLPYKVPPIDVMALLYTCET